MEILHVYKNQKDRPENPDGPFWGATLDGKFKQLTGEEKEDNSGKDQL